MAEIRAAQLKEDLIALAVLGDEVAEAVLADLPADVLAPIREATRIAWLPIVEVHEPLLFAVHAHAGNQGLRDVARAAVLRSATTRLFGPILESLVRSFGLGPAVLLRSPPIAYRATFRGMGELSLRSSAPGVARFVLGGLPGHVARDPFFEALAGGIESALAYAKMVGRVEILPGQGGGEVLFEVRWPAVRPAAARPAVHPPEGRPS